MDDPVLHGSLAPAAHGYASDLEGRLKDPPVSRERRVHLQQLCRDVLAGKRLLIASNRGPLEFSPAPEGGLQARRGRGGAVSTLKAACESCRVTWVACAMNESDREALAAAGSDPIQSPMPGHDVRVRFISPIKDEYHKYYNIVSNPLLWFLQHSMWNSPWTPNITEAVHDAWNRGYVPVNKLVASALAEEAQRADSSKLVLLQDYHLYLAPGYLRQEAPDAFIMHFTHIPWPGVNHWQLLPVTMREPVLRNLLACDIVGFQNAQSVYNFLHTCRSTLRGAHVDEDACSVEVNGWTTWVRAYPVTIDVLGLRRSLASHGARSYVDSLRSKCGEQTIIRIDRAEPSRNIVRGFKSFDRLLNRFPALSGKVRFLAFLAPSRSRIWEYQRHMDEINKLVDFINKKHGNEEWRPIELILDSNHLQNLAAMSLYDVLLVNPVTDGMSLVAKEGPIANSKDGVLVLSDTTGAYEQLQEGAIGVCPTDLEGTSEALYQALTLPREERRQMQDALRRVVESEDPVLWLYQQMAELQKRVPLRAGAEAQETAQPLGPPAV